MSTAYLEGGPANGRVVTLKDPGARVLMLIDRADMARKERGGSNVVHLYRYDRTPHWMGDHVGFTYVEGDTLP